jgi:hypothetical protein|tara:strand:- start:997 stop:1158 length:162 start_codon:yes stop_codon:yes gene_type:complete
MFDAFSPRIFMSLRRLIKACRDTENKERFTSEEQSEVMKASWELVKVIRGERK